MVEVRDDEAFVTAVSLMAALEGACTSRTVMASGLLPYLGMARCELTSYGTCLPRSLAEVSIESLPTGLDDLVALLARLRDGSQDLAFTLRVREVLLILREGIDRVEADMSEPVLHRR